MRIYGKIKVRLMADCYVVFNIVNAIKFKLNAVECGKRMRIRGTVDIRHPDDGKIIIGDDVLINSAAWANPIGFSNKTRFELFENGSIYIGNNCGLSNVCIASSSTVRIGNNVLLGAGVQIYGTDFHPIKAADRNGNDTVSHTKTADICINDNVFVGACSIILKGVHIGENSVVGAGSVVTKDIPANEVWGGNPAKCIKKLQDD